jgi:hypothetical protein
MTSWPGKGLKLGYMLRLRGLKINSQSLQRSHSIQIFRKRKEENSYIYRKSMLPAPHDAWTALYLASSYKNNMPGRHSETVL